MSREQYRQTAAASATDIAPDIIEQMAEAIARHTVRRIPLAVDLWGYAEIASYLKCAVPQVRDKLAVLPDFPRAIRLPTDGPRGGHPRYKAVDVIAWVGKFQERN